MIHNTPLVSVKKILLGIGFALAASGAHAATISLDPVSITGYRGGVSNEISFTLLANFDSTTTVGGAMDLSWDASALVFLGFGFSGTLPPRDTAFDVKDLQSPGLLSVGFGNLDGITLATPTAIGQVFFSLTGDLGSSSAITLRDSEKWAGFFDETGAPINVSYTGATATVAAVPVPAAVWLFGSGLAALFGVARRSQRHV